MANYRQIHTQIWRDNWFLDLEPDEKLLFIYLFSNDNSNLAGLYEMHERIIQLETGLDRKRINEIITKFETDEKAFYRDGVVWIVNMQKYHSNAGEKVRRNIELIIEGIPDCEVKEKYCIYNGIELEDTLSVPDDTLSEKKDTLSKIKDTLSYSKSNSKNNIKSKTEEESEPVGETNDSLWILFSDVFQNLTGIKPKPTKPVVEMLERFESAGVTVEEYRNAIKQMCEGGYSCTTMKSPETWVMNNRNRKRAGKPVQTPEARQDKFRKLYEQQKQTQIQTN